MTHIIHVHVCVVIAVRAVKHRGKIRQEFVAVDLKNQLSFRHIRAWPVANNFFPLKKVAEEIDCQLILSIFETYHINQLFLVESNLFLTRNCLSMTHLRNLKASLSHGIAREESAAQQSGECMERTLLLIQFSTVRLFYSSGISYACLDL